MPPTREVSLFLNACRLVSRAQALRRGTPLLQVCDSMCRARGLPAAVDADAAHRAVLRAATRLGRLGLANTCLIRSLALAALLADQADVRLHLGFAPTTSGPDALAGHAWVTIDRQAIPDPTVRLLDGRACDEVTVVLATRQGVRQQDPLPT